MGKELEVVRQEYARRLMLIAGVDDVRIERAFSSVPRECFLGVGPWLKLRGPKDYETTSNDDPKQVYQDCLFGITPSRSLNNGQPSFHGMLLSKVDIREGEHVVHVGAGTGYFTAIMSRLVGTSGHITAIEIDSTLASKAAENLRHYSNVEVHCGDGSSAAFSAANVVYVNAGVTRIPDLWLDRLRDHGRLLLPLTTSAAFNATADDLPGACFLISKRMQDFFVEWVSPIGIFPCQGARDEITEKMLSIAFRNGGAQNVKRLYRNTLLPRERIWCSSGNWTLAYH